LSAENTVRLVGKISRLSPLKYTPSGVAVREVVLAVPQESFGKKGVGYYAVFFAGESAEVHAQKFRIGSKLDITGSLWSREYKNRRGDKVSEIKVIAQQVIMITTRAPS